jgi:hypothetical protein
VVVASYPDVAYFDAQDAGGRSVLEPVRANQADTVRQTPQQLGIQEEDIDAALPWARER